MVSQQERRIMKEAAEISDIPVAVHLARIEGRFGVLELSTQQVTSALTALSEEMRRVSAVSAQSAANDEAIRRIWTVLEAQSKATQAAHDKANRITNMATGAMAVFSIMLGVLTWIGINALQDLKALDGRTDRIEIYIAGPKTEPYTR